jgi:hypothetical protein
VDSLASRVRVRFVVRDSLPHPGDIVVHRKVHSPPVYVLSRLDGSLQFSYSTYEEAVAHATRFARSEHLDAWYTNDDRVFERVAKHRPSVRQKSQKVIRHFVREP